MTGDIPEITGYLREITGDFFLLMPPPGRKIRAAR